jgi:hypothetical protein
MLIRNTVAILAVLILAGPAHSDAVEDAGAVAVEDAGAMVPQFQEGDVITFDQIDKIKP